MKLTDILSPECVRAPMVATDKRAAIEELVTVLAEAGKLADAEAVLQAVLERESTRSTGIGNGLAVPHGKSTGCPRLAMAVGRPAQPLEFESVDASRVELIVLLVSPPDETGPHIQALARISRLMLMEDFRSAVLSAHSGRDIYNIIAAHER